VNVRGLGRLEAVPHRRRRIPPLRQGVYLLPNLITTAGLFSGFYAIIATLNHDYRLAAIMILVAQLCDVLDGRIARLTRSSSSFGVQYDSLADLIAFGVAPGILVYTWALKPWGRWGWLAATLYVTCGALRLARFNVQVGTVERRHFLGLPIPAAANVIAATVLMYFYLGGQGAAHKRVMMLIVIYAVAALMVSEFRYFSFKEVQLHRRHPFPVLLGLIIVAMLTIAEPEPMLFIGITSYALSAPVLSLWRLLTGRRAEPPQTGTRPGSQPSESAPIALDTPGGRG
jgi:CDP-diacylglycerol--serine O-phosphatidyltransferase